MLHCSNISADRTLGQYWERRFCEMAASYEFIFTPMQIGRDKSILAFAKNESHWKHWTLPDVTIWTSPGQHHEIKHKSPTRDGCFGLEKYRFDALLDFRVITEQSVLYTIHDHSLNGGRDNQTNDIKHWFVADVLSLRETQKRTINNSSWINGIRKDNIPTHYWDKSLWKPLTEFWEINFSQIKESVGYGSK